MNGLCRLGNVKADQAGVSGTITLDDVLVRAIEQVSREFEAECDRQFFCRTETRTFAAYGGKILLLDCDLISITSITVDWDGDGTFETTLVVDDDYWLYPYNPGTYRPYRGVELNQFSNRLVNWPERAHSVRIAGTWGYSNETEDSGLTGTLSNTTSTTLTAATTAAGIIYPGDTLLIESEQVYVSAVSGTTVTVTRAVNGTTAAAHAAKSLLVRRYPRDVEMAVAERVVGLRWDSQGGYSTAATLVGDATGAAGTAPIRASYARWRRAVDRYSLPVVV